MRAIESTRSVDSIFRRQMASASLSAIAPRGEDTPWTVLTDSMATAWLALALLYVCGLLAMGTVAWRASTDIPDSADSTVAGPSPTLLTTPSPIGGSNGGKSTSPCGKTIPRTLIAIAFFTVASAVLILGWLAFFGAIVLPRLRGYRPGVGRVPYTFWSIFTPFVAYSTLTGLFIITTIGICLYSLSITRAEDTYVEDICGAPFVTLRIVGIVFLGITAVFIGIYAVCKHFLNKRAKKENRSHLAVKRRVMMKTTVSEPRL